MLSCVILTTAPRGNELCALWFFCTNKICISSPFKVSGVVAYKTLFSAQATHIGNVDILGHCINENEKIQPNHIHIFIASWSTHARDAGKSLRKITTSWPGRRAPRFIAISQMDIHSIYECGAQRTRQRPERRPLHVPQRLARVNMTNVRNSHDITNKKIHVKCERNLKTPGSLAVAATRARKQTTRPSYAHQTPYRESWDETTTLLHLLFHHPRLRTATRSPSKDTPLARYATSTQKTP